METITKDDYLKALGKDDYYRGRWGYYRAVIELLEGIEFDSCLEIGCKSLPIVKGGHTMDIERKPGKVLTFMHDARITPYDFITERYDLLLALQTFEHLEPKREIFDEWKRIANNIVISLPYMWHCPNDVEHHDITIPKVKEWTGIDPVAMQIKDCRLILKYKL